MLFDMNPEGILLLAPILVISLTVHEFAHARIALAMGDPTAKIMGRCTLNPLKHLSLFGTAALFLVGFGWAKPVPINPRNFRHPGRDDILVSLAGPASNFTLGITAALICRLILNAGNGALTSHQEMIANVMLLAAMINFVLCFFNLIPLFPLDGHHILRELLPANMRYGYMHWQVQYGQIILLILVFAPMVMTGMTSPLSLIFHYIQKMLLYIIGV